MDGPLCCGPRYQAFADPHAPVLFAPKSAGLFYARNAPDLHRQPMIKPFHSLDRVARIRERPTVRLVPAGVAA